MLAVAALAAVVLTQEPEGPAIAWAIVAIGAVVACLAGLALLRTTHAGKSARARSSRLRALRRGTEVGAAVVLVAGLQVIGGLTPLTALFVVLSFAIAEYVLSAGPTT